MPAPHSIWHRKSMRGKETCGSGGKTVHDDLQVNAQVVAPEWVGAYEPNGDRAPLGWARIIVLIAVVMGIVSV